MVVAGHTMRSRTMVIAVHVPCMGLLRWAVMMFVLLHDQMFQRFMIG